MKHHSILMRILAAAAAVVLMASALSGCKGELQTMRLSVPSNIGFDNQPNEIVLAYDAVSSTRYRDSLDGLQQQVYDQMKLALSNPQRPTSQTYETSPELDQEQMTYIANCVWIDNPVFAQTQTGAIEYAVNGNMLTMTLKQSVEDYEEHMQRASEALDRAKEIAAKVDSSWSDYDKVKYLHDYISQNCFYSVETKDTNNEAYGVFVLGESMCEGYTDAFMMLCNLVGVDSTATWFDGYINDGEDPVNGHVWNVVQMDGEYYHIDVTTNDGNATTNGETQIRPADQISYVRFGLTTEEYKAVFPEGVTFNEHNEVALPPCTATKYQYYRYHNLLFDSYDRATVAEALARNYKEVSRNGNTLSEVQFTNRTAYNQALADADYMVHDYFQLAGISEERYVSNFDDRQLVLGITLPE